MMRALYHALAAAYYGWALRSMHPAHPDAGFVQLMYALHHIEVERFLRGETP